NRLVEYAPDGSGPLTTFGDRTGDPTFNWPMALAFDPQGNFYIADTANSKIQSFTSSLVFRGAHGGTGSTADKLRRPEGVAFDAFSNRVLIADTQNNRLVSIDPATGNLLGVLPPSKGLQAGQVSLPGGIAAIPTGGFWVADSA